MHASYRWGAIDVQQRCAHPSVTFRFRNDSDPVSAQQCMGSSPLREGTEKSESENEYENRGLEFL